MADYVRRLVSGDKARYKDGELDLELGTLPIMQKMQMSCTHAITADRRTYALDYTDLAYITDNIIVMGYPATGLEGFYRNRREDAKKFLDHRHKEKYWVFNFCPVKENAYSADVFEGRVSRYPFPDHQYVHSPATYTRRSTAV